MNKPTLAEYIDGREVITSILSKANWDGIRREFRSWEDHAMENEGVFSDGSKTDLHATRWWENKDFYWAWERDRVKFGDNTTRKCKWCSKIFLTEFKESDSSHCCDEPTCLESHKLQLISQQQRFDECNKMCSGYSSLSPFQQWWFRRKLGNISRAKMNRFIELVTKDFDTYGYFDHDWLKTYDEDYRKGRDTSHFCPQEKAKRITR